MPTSLDHWEVDALLSDMAERVPSLKDWCFRNMHYLEQASPEHEDTLQSAADEIMLELKEMMRNPDYREDLSEYFKTQ